MSLRNKHTISVINVMNNSILFGQVFAYLECVFLLRLKSQTQTWGRGRSEARAAVQHTFDVLHVYKHVNRRGGIAKYP